MASKNHFNTATRKWEQLQQDGSFSAPIGESRTAILAPYDPTKVSPIVTYEHLMSQALQLADYLQQQDNGDNIDVALDATTTDFETVYTDPQYARVIILGRGSIGSVEAKDKLITWRDVSRMSDHLKTDRTYQLFCGGTPAHLNVPFGAFGVADHRNVLAPTNGRRYIPDKESAIVTYRRVKPITTDRKITMSYIQEHYPTGDTFSLQDRLNLLKDRVETHTANGELLEKVKAYILSKCVFAPSTE